MELRGFQISMEATVMDNDSGWVDDRYNVIFAVVEFFRENWTLPNMNRDIRPLAVGCVGGGGGSDTGGLLVETTPFGDCRYKCVAVVETKSVAINHLPSHWISGWGGVGPGGLGLLGGRWVRSQTCDWLSGWQGTGGSTDR